MSALFDLHTSEQPEFATTPNLTAMPSTIGQRFSATMAEAGAPDHFYNIQKAQAERYGKIIDDIHTMTGERLANPATNDATMDEIRENWGQPYPMIFQKRLDKLRTKAREVRSSMPEGGYGTEPGYLDPDMVNTQIAAESRGTREAAAKLEDTGGWVGAAAGGFVGSFENPFNILATFIPATRAPAWLAEQSVGFFLRNVGKEAVYQGATQAGAQAVSSAVEYGTRKPLGTEQTAGEIAGEIGSAAVFGAVIGGVARGAVPAWLTVRRMWGAGEYVPTAVKDAAITLEGKAIYGDKNPLGVSASANESALDKAMQDVALNRPADVSGIVEIMETPGKTIAEGIMERVNNIRAARNLPPLPPEHFGVAPATTAAEAGAQAAPIHRVTPAQYESLGPVVGVQDVFTPKIAPEGKIASKSAFFIDPQGRLIDVSAIGHPEANTRLNEMAGLGREHEGGFHGGESPVVRVDATTVGGEISLGVNAYEGGVTAAQKRMIDQIEREVAISKRKGENISYQGEVSKDYGGAPVGDLKDVKITDAAPPVPAAEAEKAVADARLQGAAAEAAPTPTAPAAEAVSPELQRLQKMADEIEKGAPQKPTAQVPPTAEARPVAPAPEQPARVAKPPGESPEDKAVLDQAKRMIESPEVAVPPEKRAAYNDALKQEQEAKVAAGCLAGAI